MTGGRSKVLSQLRTRRFLFGGVKIAPWYGHKRVDDSRPSLMQPPFFLAWRLVARHSLCALRVGWAHIHKRSRAVPDWTDCTWMASH
jgi:hypothetical protein